MVQTDTVKTELNTYLYTFLAKKKPGSRYFTPKDFSPRFLKRTLFYRNHGSVLGNLSFPPSVFPLSHLSCFISPSKVSTQPVSSHGHSTGSDVSAWIPPSLLGSPSGRRVRAGYLGVPPPSQTRGCELQAQSLALVRTPQKSQVTLGPRAVTLSCPGAACKGLG